ncbi:PP2C family protein-serine/threonine phosphatase [candidate division KSB1 bacterium]|nr:PP2C family protein-serine/threonine phosphatase [candidate division KSB1 bacterium]
MTDPKLFYRELDALLAKIRMESGGGNFFRYILKELDSAFGRRLNLGHGRIYELHGRAFVLLFTTDEGDRRVFCRELAVESEVVHLAYQNRSYLYDRPQHIRSFFCDPDAAAPAQAAIWVHSPDRSWLFVFSLLQGWEREEINLFTNSVRLALNYRLFSDTIGGRLEQTVQIQKSLLPKRSPVYAGYQIFGHSQPAELVGGDFYDYFDLEDGGFGVSLGDASGHGLPAALLVRDVVIGLRMGLSMDFRTGTVLRRLNRVIQRSTFASNYVSLFVGEIEDDGHLFYINAGHPAPLLVSPSSTRQLESTGITLGFLPDIELHRGYEHMTPESMLVLYSDGIIERNEHNDDMFGLQRLISLVEKSRHLEAQAIVERIFETVFAFGGDAPWEDDATVVVIKRL